MNDYRIQYILTMPKQRLEDASLFFGFVPGVIDCLAMTQKLLRLPQHSVQLGLNKDKRIAMKIGGGTYRFVPIEVDVLPHLSIKPNIPFWCIVSNEATHNDVNDFIRSIEHPILHISTINTDETVPIEGCEDRHLLDYCNKVLAYLRKKNCAEQINFFRGFPTKLRPQPSRCLPLVRRHHFMTHPNETVLDSNGYSFAGDGRIDFFNNDAPYIEAILKSANAVKNERERILEFTGTIWPSPVDLILTCPAFYQHLYVGQLKLLPEMEIARKWIAAYRRQKHYFIERFPFDPKDIQTDEFGFVLSLYKTEIQAYSRAVAIKAANHFVPTLRLPPVLNLIYEDLGNLAKCSRADSHRSAFKQEKIYKKITDALTVGVPKEFFSLIDTHGNKIKLIGNAPLEWLPVRDLPLMIRYEVSRIPTTPGNVLFTLTGASNEMGVSSSAFDEILIVRSYHPEDKIRNLLSEAINTMRNGLAPNMQIRIVDISTSEEFINVVNAFRGMILIYDGHGQASIKDVGAIIIGGKPVDLYQFRTSLRVPPIVILSSCDTHAIDGSHASVANTFLMLGATTVLGTLLPVNAADAALFTSRLIFRISEYIPMVTKKLKRPLRWSSVISGMQKMAYVTEQVQRLFKSRKLEMTPQNFFPIQSCANALIVNNDPDWYEKTVALIAKSLNQSETATQNELTSFRVVDVIKYIQLGNPDQILITDDPRHEPDFKNI